jgi:acetyltransferase-like isoleucine patch superfamily enzyme
MNYSELMKRRHPSQSPFKVEVKVVSCGHMIGSSAIGNASLFIEDEVDTGTGAIILAGVTVGKGSVVGARTAVLHDVAPSSVVAGNPAHY